VRTCVRDLACVRGVTRDLQNLLLLTNGIPVPTVHSALDRSDRLKLRPYPDFFQPVPEVYIEKGIFLVDCLLTRRSRNAARHQTVLGSREYRKRRLADAVRIPLNRHRRKNPAKRLLRLRAASRLFSLPKSLRRKKIQKAPTRPTIHPSNGPRWIPNRA
jgi:hypothetical protein